MNKDPNHFIDSIIKVCEYLSALADEAEANSNDDSCCVLYGVVRDCAYKMSGRAKKEKELHQKIITKASNLGEK